ncbi:hypothetical protein PCIT_b1133 [Pseudoalteromonas citrea]|uniref:Uncharacterized protein n=1 Tax=Pseudoalteromonas citrea TaxID=43655 RepID=A0AAD4AFJ4_9GAMM|nr:hypothetical protein PCIT_b1133 [Pseudoalteromonas citrea]
MIKKQVVSARCNVFVEWLIFSSVRQMLKLDIVSGVYAV